MDPQLTDEQLAAQLAAGEEQALAELMERYSGKLVRYGHRFLASEDDIGDIVQDVFISVYENIRDFDATRRFSPWIYRIAHNAFVNGLRKRSHEPLYGLDLDLDRLMPHAVVYEDPALKEKEAEELRVLVDTGLDKLPAHYRDVINLYYFEHFGYQEIADILHIPLGTVGIRLSRAKAALKKHLPQDL